MRTTSILLVALIFGCSYHRVHIGSECLAEYSYLGEIMGILSEHDIRDFRTRKIIRRFFRSEEDLDRFISSVVYRIREQSAFYGTFSSYDVRAYRVLNDRCEFDVLIVLRKRYSLDNVEISVPIVIMRDGELLFVSPPEHVGDIKERRGFLGPN